MIRPLSGAPRVVFVMRESTSRLSTRTGVSGSVIESGPLDRACAGEVARTAGGAAEDNPNRIASAKRASRAGIFTTLTYCVAVGRGSGVGGSAVDVGGSGLVGGGVGWGAGGFVGLGPESPGVFGGGAGMGVSVAVGGRVGTRVRVGVVVNVWVAVGVELAVGVREAGEGGGIGGMISSG